MTDRPPDQPGWAAPDPPPPPTAGGWIPDLTAPGPPGPTAGAPLPPIGPTSSPRRPRRRWLVVLLSVLGVLVLTLIVGTVLFFTRTFPPFNGARHFLDDVNHGNDDAATGRLCSADSSDASTALDTVRGTFSNGKSYAVNPLGVDRSGSTADISYSVTRQDGSTHTFHLTVVDEGGSWKACP